MKSFVLSVLLLALTVEGSSNSRFFISAPNVFHVGVKEKVFVQMGKDHLNKIISIYLEHETTNTVVSEVKTVVCETEEKGKIVELMIDQTLMSRLSQRPRYLTVVAESSSLGRKMTKVQLSQHRGYIYIQTDQPVYKPSDKVQFRIFTLDHTFRPSDEVFDLSIYNAIGNRIMKTSYNTKEGLLSRHFIIPDVAKTGTWKIVTHYQGDQAHAVSREFKVQKFVMPSFEVNIQMEHKYVLVKDKEISFRILARYSHGSSVTGAYHCQFGVTKKGSKANPVLLRGMEHTGSVKDGIASFSVNISKLSWCLEQLNRTLSDLEVQEELLYLGIFVTNIQSGEIQEHKIYIPVVSHRYNIDLSRTRSNFIPGFPINVAVQVKLPDGTPAEKVSVTMGLKEETKESQTNQQGAVFNTFNVMSKRSITLTVSAGDSRETKVLTPVSSGADTYLYLSVDHKQYTVGDSLQVMYKTKNAPQTGVIHYLVLSRGAIVQTGHVDLRETSVNRLQITEDMVPSMRLIGYFYSSNNDIISDSVWLSVKSNCEEKTMVTLKGSEPGKISKMEIDLNGQEATVALLAVDKALYSLKADNKLTSEQVYSSMEAYDLGCSYGGGLDPKSVLVDAGLSFFSKNQQGWREDLRCQSTSRQKRSVDLEQEIITLKSKFEGEMLQSCCVQGFLLIPMKRTCEERAERVRQMQSNSNCTEVFLSCCKEGERLREQKTKEDAKKGLGRTASLFDVEEYFLNNPDTYVRKLFSASFAFTSFSVTGTASYNLHLPDSITTWEIQVITFSKASGLCVNVPALLPARKPAFVSLRLPHSVKKYEQMYISPVIYNYDYDTLHVAVHMEQTEGLCSPGSATSASFVTITVNQSCSQAVTFSAVPMKTGSIPIKIRLLDINKQNEIDAIQKPLNVWTEGIEKSEEALAVIHLNGTTDTIRTTIDAKLPDDIVPESSSNIFISLGDEGLGSSRVRNLLNPETVAPLIVLPDGCLEQTTSKLVPTALAIHYLDMSDQWFNMPTGARDDALNKLAHGVQRIAAILNEKTGGSYGSWPTLKRSTWLTAHVLKVLSLLSKRQRFTFGSEGRKSIYAPIKEIGESVRYLCSKQTNRGSFGDANPVMHRGILKGVDGDAAITAFVTLALNHSLEFLDEEDKVATETKIIKSTSYLWSNFRQLDHPFAVAITAYCLSVRMREQLVQALDWTKFEAKDKAAITVETAAYALLTAVALQKHEQAHKLAQWLTTQENYKGGFFSSQDTLLALEALAEYELMRPVRSEADIEASFTVIGRSDVRKLHLENKVKVETDLKRFIGNVVRAQFNGRGTATLKVFKVYHLMEPKDVCDQLSIKVTVTGKVKYTPTIIENYDYYEYEEEKDGEVRVARSAIEWLDIRTRRRRDVTNEQTSDDFVTYKVCVGHSPSYNLSGMAIVDITLLSGFVAEEEDLETLKTPPEQYISHYEVSSGRVIIYLNEVVEAEQCFEFDAKQQCQVGLLQPAPAVFYDYYEPSKKCTVFYSAPKRSKVISKLCSGDVCQCAERPCHKLQNTFSHPKEDRPVTLSDRQEHACFYPLDDYAYMVKVLEVSEKNNFELYKTIVTDVLKSRGDKLVKIGSHRVFAKRRQCKSKLDVETEYLIMGKDGTTTDSRGETQYLLEVSTWVEPKPLDCAKTAHTPACNEFTKFVEEFKVYSCKL